MKDSMSNEQAEDLYRSLGGATERSHRGFGLVKGMLRRLSRFKRLLAVPTQVTKR